MSVAPVPGLRDRRRAQTVAEIKAAALAQLDQVGAAEMSLRAVAREVGVSVQALYHYFGSRDELLTALITDAFTSVTEVVAQAAQQPGLTGRERLVAAGLAYRSWAVAHRSAFLLALGAPLPDYSAPVGGPTSVAASRMGEAFLQAVFGGWQPAELAAVPLPDDPALPGGAAAAAPGEQPFGLPPGARALFVGGWASLHGVVVLEMLGHLDWTATPGEDLCRAVLLRYADLVETNRA